VSDVHHPIDEDRRVRSVRHTERRSAAPERDPKVVLPIWAATSESPWASESYEDLVALVKQMWRTSEMTTREAEERLRYFADLYGREPECLTDD
jgi:hypothetical protein